MSTSPKVSSIEKCAQWVLQTICVPFFNSRRLHTGIFGISSAIYWVYYDKMQNSYISRIYMNDKYGVVLVYAALNVLSTFHDLMEINEFKHGDRVRQIKKEVAAQGGKATEATLPNLDHRPKVAHYVSVDAEKERREKLKTYRKQVIVSSALKMLLFTFIFKNSTSQTDAHQQTIHLFFTGVLGFFGLCQQIAIPNEERKGADLDPRPSDWELLFRMILHSVSFSYFGTITDLIKPGISLQQLLHQSYGPLCFVLVPLGLGYELHRFVSWVLSFRNKKDATKPSPYPLDPAEVSSVPQASKWQIITSTVKSIVVEYGLTTVFSVLVSGSCYAYLKDRPVADLKIFFNLATMCSEALAIQNTL